MNTKQETREATQQISQQNQSMKLNQLHCIEAAINQIASVTRTTPGHIIVNLTPICWNPEQAEQIREFMSFDREVERLREGIREIISRPDYTNPERMTQRLHDLLANSQDQAPLPDAKQEGGAE